MGERNLRIEVILAGIDRVTAPFRKTQKASADLGKELKSARDRLKQLDAAQRDLEGFTHLEKEIVSSRLEMTRAKATVAELQRKFAEAEAPTKRLTNQFTKAREAVAKLEAKQGDEIRRLGELRGKLEAAGMSTGDLAGHQARLKRETDDTNRSIDAQKTKLSELGERQKRMGAASGIMGKASGRAGKVAAIGAVAGGAAAMTGAAVMGQARGAMTYEDAIADVKKVVNFDGPRDLEAFSRRLLDVSTEIPGMEAAALGQIAAAAGRAGIAKNQIIDFTQDAARMGVAFDVSAEDAGGMMATWRTAFDLTQPKVKDLANQVNALTNTFGGDAGDVAGIVTRIGALGDVAGVSAGQVAAMGSLMSKLSIEEDTGATGIKNLMLSLTKGTAATKQQQEAFQALGLDAVQVSKDMQRDAGGTILSVMEKLRALPKEQQAGMLTDLFGSESVAAIAPMLSQLDQLKERFKLVGDAAGYSGSMDKEYQARIATSSGAVGLAKNGLQAINIEMGQKLLPIIAAVSGKISGVAKNFRAWSKEHPKLFDAMSKGGLVIGVLVAAIAAIALVVAPIILFIGALGAAAAALSVPIGALVGTILGIVGIVIAVVAAVIGAIKGWHKLAPIVGAFFAAIRDRIVEAVSFIFALHQRFVDAGAHIVAGLANGIRNGLGAVKKAITDAGGQVVAWFKEKLGIHSPSRVFAGLGGYVMQGLDEGLQRGERGPLARVRAMAGSMTAAMAVTMAPQASIAAPSARPGPTTPGPAAAAQPPPVIHIHIHAAPGMNEEALVKQAVSQFSDKVAAQAAPSRRNASYADGWK